VIVNVTFVPTAGAGFETVFVTAMSATPFGTRTVAVEVLLPGVGSGVDDETVAVLTIGAGAG
jgi:hypothetical protein